MENHKDTKTQFTIEEAEKNFEDVISAVDETGHAEITVQGETKYIIYDLDHLGIGKFLGVSRAF